ncbi:uncharacterized protein LOC113333788 [Papaver somniferum]|uniref:uncharacterized protein LOC113333788 n=1 Tax=Papaver somniferum TaxID=3469 RepID=UPI000E6F628B|nr:uncharacterized protein LOC113333788 [Papaver somniferum]
MPTPRWPPVSSLPPFAPPSDVSFNVGNVGESYSMGSLCGNAFWSTSCSTFSRLWSPLRVFFFGAASKMNFNSDEFMSFNPINDLMNDIDHNDESLDNVILEPIPLASLTPEPVITDEEFEKEIDLMMLDSDPLAAETSHSHDLLSPDFKNVLINSWSKFVTGSPSFIAAGKLKNLKHDLIYWNRNSFGHIKTTIGKLNSEIEKLQFMPYSPSIGSFILNYSKQLDYWYEPYNVVIEEVLKDIQLVITNDINIRLTAIPTSEEIHETIRNMAPWKSPGPDGFPGGFFIDNWNEVSIEVINHVQSFFQNKFLLKQLNHAFIALIPKSAFIANMQIQDNILISHEILHSFKTRKRKNNKNGFMAINTVSYSVLVNGSPGEIFIPTRGIRQGDCLSPYIFILCMETLSQLLLKGQNDNLIQGFKLRKNSPSISYLFLADDCMLFSKASLTYSRNLMKIIDSFAKASGQAINFEKSDFFTSNKMHHKHVKLLGRTLGIKFLSSSEKYLRTPLFVNRNKTKSFQFLINKFYSRLSNCMKTNLNVSGRTVVTKHVLSSLAVYHMSCFPFPKKIITEIDSIQKTFWWSKKDPRRAAYYKSWGDIGKSKLNGGLGIKNTYATNRVFIEKIGWRMCKKPDHLVSRFFKDKYFPNQSLLEIDKAADRSSWIWKGMVKGMKFIKANIVYKINDGKATSIWSSNWFPFSSSPPISINPNFTNFDFVSDLIDMQNNSWNLSLINSLFSQDDVNIIISLRINTNKQDDIMWAHTRNGKFTIKSAYKAFMNEIVTVEDASF